MKIVMIMKCPKCGSKKEIGEGEVPNGSYPLCDKDGMPLIAVRAEKRK